MGEISSIHVAGRDVPFNVQQFTQYYVHRFFLIKVYHASDKSGVLVFSRLVCMRYCLYSTNLYAWLMRGFGIGVVWNP